MRLKIHPETPSPRQIEKVVEVLKQGGVIIYPTDSVYGIGCDINNQKAVERVAQIKGIKPQDANFSFICHDLSDLSQYTVQVDNRAFKLMKKNLPGPFTFILKANNKVPKLFKSHKKTVGIRVPDHNIAREIVKELGNPIMTTSVHDDKNTQEYATDPDLIWEKFKERVDLFIDAGHGSHEPSTVVDCVEDEFEIVRQGKGVFE